MMCVRKVLLLMAIAALVSCAPPPRTVETQPAPPDETSPAVTEEPATPYDFESEGTVPADETDVQFEEDLLPPPESVTAPALDDAPVESADLDTLPAIEGDDVSQPTVTTPVQPEVETPVPPSKELPVKGQEPVRGRRGFRVQLVAVTDRTEAEKVAREARNRLGVETYVVLEGPYFKVRAGDFVDRGGAVLMRDRARSNGYPQAWVTPTEISSGE